jgi:hypothetical protein
MRRFVLNSNTASSMAFSASALLLNEPPNLYPCLSIPLGKRVFVTMRLLSHADTQTMSGTRVNIRVRAIPTAPDGMMRRPLPSPSVQTACSSVRSAPSASMFKCFCPALMVSLVDIT